MLFVVLVEREKEEEEEGRTRSEVDCSKLEKQQGSGKADGEYQQGKRPDAYRVVVPPAVNGLA